MVKHFTIQMFWLAPVLLSSCALAQTPTQVDFMNQVKSKFAYPVTQNTTNLAGGYMVFSPVSYNPFDSPSACIDQWGNPVQQPLPPAGQAAFGINDIVLWNSLSPSMPFANGTGQYGLVQKMVVTSSPVTTNTGPCGLVLPINTDFGLNLNAYIFPRGGVATDNPFYNAFQALQGGMTANSYTAGVLYPAGTVVCTAMTGSVCSSQRTLVVPEYLGGHVDTGHSTAPPQGNTMQGSTNPFSGGEGLVAGMIYYDETNHCESVYSGTAWGCIGSGGGGGSPGGPTNSLQINGGGTFTGFAALTYSSGPNVVTLNGSAGQGFISPLFNAYAGSTNVEFQGTKFSVLGNGGTRSNGWFDLSYTGAVAGPTAGPTPTAGHALLYMDSGTNLLMASVNGSAAVNLLSGGGGGSPGGPSNSLQINGGGTFTGFAALTYNSGTNVVTLAGAANQGFIAPLFNASAGSTNLEFQGTKFSVLGNGATRSNGWVDLSYTGAPSGPTGAPTPTAGHSLIYTDSGTNQLMASVNGAAAVNLLGGGGGTPGAPSTSVQFNSSGSFAGNASFTWNNASGNLNVCPTLGGICTASSGVNAQAFSSSATGTGTAYTDIGANFTIQGNGTGNFQALNVGGGSPLTINSSGTLTTSSGLSASTMNISGAAFFASGAEIDTGGIGFFTAVQSTGTIAATQYRVTGSSPLIVIDGASGGHFSSMTVTGLTTNSGGKFVCATTGGLLYTTTTTC